MRACTARQLAVFLAEDLRALNRVYSGQAQAQRMAASWMEDPPCAARRLVRDRLERGVRLLNGAIKEYHEAAYWAGVLATELELEAQGPARLPLLGRSVRPPLVLDERENRE